MKIFLKYITNLWLLGIVLLLCGSIVQAQNDIIYIGGIHTVKTGENLQWYGNVELASDAELYIEDGAKITFYGATLKVNPGAKISGADGAWAILTAGSGTGSIVFQQANPNDNNTVQQTLDGGNSGNPANATQNTFTSIEINNTLGVMLVNTDTRIGSALIFTAGHLYTDTHDMVLSSAAGLAGYDATRYVVTASSGHLVKESYTGAFTFPVGIADNDYTPADVNSVADETFHVNVASYTTSGSEEFGQNGINRTWNIYGNAGNVGATVSLQHNLATNQTDFNDASCFVTQWSAAAPNLSGQTTTSNTPWQSNNLGAGSGVGSLTTGIPIAGASVRTLSYSSFATSAASPTAYFTKSSDPFYPLPLNLLGFTGQKKEQTVVLKWRVENQVNTDRFEIEYSTDGTNWRKISSQKAAGNYAGELSYHYIHTTPVTGMNYYRLKMIDQDGNYTYSINVVSVNFVAQAPAACLSIARVYSVPFITELHIDLYSCKAKAATLQLYDIQGKKVVEERQSLTEGTAQYILHNLNHLPAGSYILRVQTDSEVLVQNVVK